MSCAMSPAMFSHNKAVIIRVRAAACCAAIDAVGRGRVSDEAATSRASTGCC